MIRPFVPYKKGLQKTGEKLKYNPVGRIITASTMIAVYWVIRRNKDGIRKILRMKNKP